MDRNPDPEEFKRYIFDAAQPGWVTTWRGVEHLRPIHQYETWNGQVVLVRHLVDEESELWRADDAAKRLGGDAGKGEVLACGSRFGSNASRAQLPQSFQDAAELISDNKMVGDGAPASICPECHAVWEKKNLAKVRNVVKVNRR